MDRTSCFLLEIKRFRCCWVCSWGIQSPDQYNRGLTIGNLSQTSGLNSLTFHLPLFLHHISLFPACMRQDIIRYIVYIKHVPGMSCIAHLAVSEIFLQSSPSMFFCCGWRWTGLLHCSTPLLERCVYHTTARELIQLDPICSIQATSSYTEKLQTSFPRLICHWENKSICTIHGVSASTLTGQEHMTSTQSWPLSWQYTMIGIVLCWQSKFSMIRLLFVQYNMKAIVSSSQTLQDKFISTGIQFRIKFRLTHSIMFIESSPFHVHDLALLPNFCHLQSKKQKSLVASFPGAGRKKKVPAIMNYIHTAVMS